MIRLNQVLKYKKSMESTALWQYDLELWATRSKYGYSLWLFAKGGENEPRQLASGTLGRWDLLLPLPCMHGSVHQIIKYCLQTKMTLLSLYRTNLSLNSEDREGCNVRVLSRF
jgi:hypothetical protein